MGILLRFLTVALKEGLIELQRSETQRDQMLIIVSIIHLA